MKQLFRTLLILFFVLSLLLQLSCLGYDKKAARKERIAFWVSTLSTKDIQSVASQLEEWHFPAFSSTKMLLVEEKFEQSYYKDLPDKEALAKETARIYLENFYDDTNIDNEEENTFAVISAYISAVGDTYGMYRSPTQYKDYNQNLSGEYVGIGVSVHHDAKVGIIEITEVVPDGPAYEAGILPRDILYAVDGLLAEELGYDETVAHVRGEVDTTVEITVKRGEELFTFSIVRRAMTDQTVRYSLDEESGIAYVRITQFKGNTAELFYAAIDALEENPLTKAYIFDVRDNPGGYLYTVVNMLAYLTAEGSTIVTFTEGYSEPMYDTDTHEVNKPMIILTSEYTASAGELFASSLSENKDCEIVGKTTYGKGVMQNTYQFTDGSSITLTISEYNPPSGINYDGVGVTPDYEVENTAEDDRQLAFACEKLLEKINK